MCEEFHAEFKKLSKLFNEDDKKYFEEAQLYPIPYPYPGRGYYMWKKTDNATFYRRYENDYMRGSFRVYNRKIIAIYGLDKLYDRCRREKIE